MFLTGPAEGKLLLNAEVYLVSHNGRKKVESEVYIHMKGYALARVTHLDIESLELDGLIPPRKGLFLSIIGVKGGLKIVLDKPVKIESWENPVLSIEVKHPLLNKVLRVGEKTRTWVGGKYGGIYIGFRKEHIIRLERVAREDLGFNG